MSVRNGILALLETEPMYGYQIRAEFEARTGGTWPLNIGQVYTTLNRLARDGLVTWADPTDAVAAAGAVDVPDRLRHLLTPRGHEEVTSWFRTPVSRAAPPRDELAIKLALALTTPGVDVTDVVRRQRTATIRVLQDYTRLKRRADEQGDLAWLLVLDGLVFQTEAEVRWLDHCESRLARAAQSPAATTSSAQTRADPTIDVHLTALDRR